MNILTNKQFGLVVIVLMLIFSAAIFSSLPEQVPSHYNLSGEVDETAPRWVVALIMPGIALFVWITLHIVPVIDPRRDAYESFRPTFNRLKGGLIVFLGLMHVIILTRYDDPDMVTRFALIGISALMAFIANELGRVRQTWLTGIRTPWTLSSETVWRKTHRVGGRALFIAGVIGLIAAIVLPVEAAGIIVLVAILGASLGAVIYSYVLWREENQTAQQS